MLNTNK